MTLQFGHNDQKPAKGIPLAQYAANLGRLDAEEQRKWEQDTGRSSPDDDDDDDDDVDVHDSISCVAPPHSEVTSLGGLMRRHERGG